MIATLHGRWQTRIFLLLIVGSITTLPIGLWYMWIEGSIWGLITPYTLLLLVLVLGLIWETLYNYLQTWRWERDWPPVFVLVTGFLEAAFIWFLITLWNGSSEAQINGAQVKEWQFVLHYLIVWLVTFSFSQGPMRILFPRWRFKGGEFGPLHSDLD